MSMSSNVRKLKNFLVDHYAHRMPDPMVGPWTDKEVIAVAIALLTPGDGSEAAWERMYTACGVRGIVAQRELVVQTAAMLTVEPAAPTSHERA